MNELNLFQLLEVKITFMVENHDVISDDYFKEILGDIEALYRDLKK